MWKDDCFLGAIISATVFFFLGGGVESRLRYLVF